MAQTSIACQVTALSTKQRERRAEIVKKLSKVVDKVNELENGYAFRYPLETITWMEIAEFVDLERQCCAFFTFELKLTSESHYAWLQLSGGETVKKFLQNHEDFAA
jgi:hypothetical protein